MLQGGAEVLDDFVSSLGYGRDSSSLLSALLRKSNGSSTIYQSTQFRIVIQDNVYVTAKPPILSAKLRTIFP